MMNFLDLLATDFKLTISVNGTVSESGLLDPLVFRETDTVTVDGFEVLPRYQHLAQQGRLIIDESFYQWLHRVTNQGWLLKPQPQMYPLNRSV